MNKPQKHALLAITALAAVNVAAIEVYGLTFFNVVRVALAVSGGWYLVARADSGLWFSMLAGIVVFVTDHLILTNVSLLFLDSSELAPGDLPTAALGVVLSFIMFAPVAAALALIGGAIARVFQTRRPIAAFEGKIASEG